MVRISIVSFGNITKSTPFSKGATYDQIFNSIATMPIVGGTANYMIMLRHVEENVFDLQNKLPKILVIFALSKDYEKSVLETFKAAKEESIKMLLVDMMEEDLSTINTFVLNSGGIRYSISEPGKLPTILPILDHLAYNSKGVFAF